MWLSWLRHQIHSQYKAGASIVRTIQISLTIICRSDYI